MKTEIPKTFTDVSNALTAGCSWQVDHIVSNVSVLFNQSQEEKFIRGVQGSGTSLYVITADDIEEPIDLIQLTPEDIVYVTTED